MPAFLHLVLHVLEAALVLATLPLTVELLILSIAAALPQRKRSTAASGFRLAVVIPAHNEQALIANCVSSILNQADAPFDVYVIAHNCSDSTAHRAAEAGAIALELNDGIGGKGLALDFGFRHALAKGAQAVLVIDADSVAGPNLIAAVTSAFAAGAEALQCRYEVANVNTSANTRLAALAFLGMNVLRPLGRYRLGLSCGIFGNGFALSAATLSRVPYVANSLVEDLEYHLHLIRAGICVRFLDHAAVLGEMPETSASAASQRARWEGGRMLMRRLWTMPLLVEALRGNFCMLEPLLDLLALPLAINLALLLPALAMGAVSDELWLTLCAATGLSAIALYVLVAASLSSDPERTLQALAAAPFYLVWKLLLIPRTRLAARSGAAWVRTQRNAERDEAKLGDVELTDES